MNKFSVGQKVVVLTYWIGDNGWDYVSFSGEITRLRKLTLQPNLVGWYYDIQGDHVKYPPLNAVIINSSSVPEHDIWPAEDPLKALALNGGKLEIKR